ncbi:MAG: pullulanase-type alpha-1,6-glucosidase [Herpetosiphonaceae bacterium]|nr:pullulanase-type alpha-1,6-glucosidase [Herpetosiphonaceae bacterium]
MVSPRTRAMLALLLLLAMLLATLPPTTPAEASDTPDPATVTVPGTIQSVLGCPGDWQPDCKNTYLTFEEGVWQGTFEVPAGSYEYKVALNDSWDENYGQRGARGGANLALTLAEPTSVTFIYDHATHAVADSVNAPISVVLGTFQDELGCAQDNAPDCLASWLQDPDGDGTFSFVTTLIPAGTYEAKVARNQTSDETYGADGTPGGAAATFTVANPGDEIYFGFKSSDNTLVISTEGAPRGNITVPYAHWVAQDAILWNVIGSPRYTYELHYAPEAGLEQTATGITGGEMLPLTFASGGPGAGVFERFPHLQGFSALRLAAADLDKVPAILQGQVAVLARDQDGNVVDASGLQIPGVLDDVYRYTGDLGVSYAGAVPTIRVWAPTARNVTLLRFADANPGTAPVSAAMTFDPASGVWSSVGQADWTSQYYLFEVEVYVPATSKIERNLVTDPYSISLATNSTRSQIVNLGDPSLAPAGWEAVAKPALATPEDIVLYELHVRDFSITDASVPEEQRGTFKAFSNTESNGMQHLKALAQAGLTHIHLLPVFDIATIEEDRSQQQRNDFAQLAGLAPDSEEQQATIEPGRDQDGFNWGYDPFHYTTPEGSYSTNPDGTTRITEFREMVQALNASGLRVVMDVVYNHTNSNGQNPRSVLDRIVPGYYHRLNEKGEVQNSTCCSNTATEHAMMEKLMVDSLRTWATVYKVDGFRFDLMGHHMLSNMTNVRAMLDSLTLEKDGVDGTGIYIYGEGWNFGEVADGARGVNATQLTMGGTGIGTFSDRLRDAARGGGPFSGFQEQGFITGLADAPNGTEQGTVEEQRANILLFSDQIRVGLAGNLKNYSFVDRNGNTVTGEKVTYNGQPAGYTLDPQEHIVYVSAHDNETLFDAVQAKAPATAPLAERVRMHNLGLSLVALAQGVPFFHAGDDLLRSKSLDRNSYNSGDWFNRIDWTGQESTWGAGLPPSADNQDNWPLMKPLLGNPGLKPTPADIAAASANFREMLQIRRSSPLFRLQTAEDIQAKLSFSNTGPAQIPGVIMMSLTDAGADLDQQYDRIVVVFNSTSQPQTITEAALQDADFSLHPVQAASADPLVKTATFDPTSGGFTVPGRTTAVFVQAEVGDLADPGTTSDAATPTTVAEQVTAAPTVVAEVATAAPFATPTSELAAPTPAAEASSGSSTVIWVSVGVVLVTLATVLGLKRRRR